MTMPSRGVAKIQTKATGDAMKCGMRKGGKLPNKKKASMKISKMDKANVGMADSAGGIPGMMGKGYAKGGKIDGCAKKGHTKGRMV